MDKLLTYLKKNGYTADIDFVKVDEEKQTEICVGRNLARYMDPTKKVPQ